MIDELRTGRFEMIGETTYKDAIAKAAHYIAIGQTRIWLNASDPDLPWHLVDVVGAAGSYRFNGPASVRLTAHEAGLELHWYVDFEGRDSNGMGFSLFDRDRLRGVMMKLPRSTRIKFAAFLENEVLPDLQKRTDEMREAMNKQNDSEDCVRGLIDFGRREEAA